MLDSKLIKVTGLESVRLRADFHFVDSYIK